MALVPLLWSLWWAKPDGSGLGEGPILVVLGAVTGLAALADLLFNSMMHFAVGRERAAKASGLALTMANVVGVLVLIAVLWGFELPGKMHLPFLPSRPLFGLNAAQYEPARMVGPVSGAIWIIFSLPLFLLAPDGLRTGRNLAQSVRDGVGGLSSLLRSAPKLNRDLAIFLGARVAYFDAAGAYVVFNGVYAAGAMGWKGPQMLILGISTAGFCMFGGLVAQALDRSIGPRRALLIALSALCAFIFCQIGTNKTHILYIDVQQHRLVGINPGAFYLVTAMGAAVFLAATGASTRTLLARLAPAGQLGTVVGLAALTGSSTAWLMPLTIGALTTAFHSQQVGFAPLLLMLMLGAVGLSLVRGGGRWRTGVDEEILPQPRLVGRPPDEPGVKVAN
jgi:UMF1 family MFS transporter